MERPTNPALDWSTLRSEGGNLTIHFATGRPLHIVVVPEEVLEDGLGTREQEAKSDALAHKSNVELATKRAFSSGEWLELVEVSAGTKIHQLWINRAHFERF